MQSAACRALGRAVAPAAVSRKKQANWTIEPRAVKRRRRTHEGWKQAPQPQLLLRAPAAAAAGPQLSPAPAADAQVSIAFCVPECRLQPGEHLRVVGGSPELGDWHVDAALPLEWQEGDAWTAQLSLPPGRHEFKLVVLRDRDGAVLWEDGPNRELPLQPQAAADAADADGQPAVIVSCPWGDPAATTPTPAAALPGQGQVQEGAAEAAQAQVADMRRQLRQLADRAAALEREVQQCEAAITERESVLQQLVAAEGRRVERAAVPEAAAGGAAGASAAAEPDSTVAARLASEKAEPAQLQGALPVREAAATPTAQPVSSSGSGVGQLGEAPAAAENGAGERGGTVAEPLPAAAQQQIPDVQPASQPAVSAAPKQAPLTAARASAAAAVPASASSAGGSSMDGALVDAAPDGTLSFRFDAPPSGGGGGGPQRSAADLARERLLGRLPPGAAEDLEQRLQRMKLGAESGAAAATAPPSALSPSTRGGSPALGNTPRPAAASSGDWEQPRRRAPRKPRQRQQQPPARVASPPRPAGDAAAATADPGPAPLAPPTDQSEPAHLLPMPAAAAAQPLLGQGRGSAGTDVTMRASLPAAALWLTLAAVASLGEAAWGVGRGALPPAARRPADAAFWLVFAAAVAAPFWQ